MNIVIVDIHFIGLWKSEHWETHERSLGKNNALNNTSGLLF